MSTADLEVVVGEFGLGPVINSGRLPGGGHDVIKLRTERGAYVIKRPWDRLDVELYAEVEQHLNRQGIRQARQHRRPGGELLASSGHAVQEFLPGMIVDPLDRTRTLNLMRWLADHDRALAAITPPSELAARDTVWARVVRTDYLLTELPGLFARHAPDGLDPAPVRRLLDLLADGAATLAAQPRQLVHGDLGPDNVLFDGEAVLAVIDFTPFHDTVLLGLASAVYFGQLLGTSPAADRDRQRTEIEESFAAYGTEALSADRSLPWTALVLEALRRLATPLAVVEAGGTPPAPERTRRRYAAAARLAALL
ncbi:phosphotransferase enzyme family protein [Microlunatus speluncae]|uniref:phosphotransferase enzyme family protein n=1 Tax=Microlunatus speluncae TaxID=2594267 RepID=UPI001375A622|nr:phosphotransferase [Microlunatus speluncae]